MRSPLVLLIVGFFLLLGAVIGVGIFTYSVERSTDQQADLLTASGRLLALFSAIQDVEAGQRGYLVTKDPSYLKPYQNAVKALPARIAAVEQALADRPLQEADLKQLKALIPQKLDELKETIDLEDAGHSADALAVVESGRGEQTMDQIRAVVQRMRDRQVTALAAVGQAVNEAGTRLTIGVAAVALVVLLLTAWAFAAKRRQRIEIEAHSRAVEAHSRALEESNRQLGEEMRSRQTAEEQIRQMQKMEAVGQLTGGLAHDFNNMLAVILGALGLAQRRLAKNDFDIRKYLEAAIDACNRASNLTKRLLAFSRQQPLAPETLDANKLVADMSELLRRTLGETTRLETVLAGGLWRVRVDPSQLENSIVNLAVNSRDAMPEGGRITIETANCSLDDEYVRLNAGAQAGQYVMVAVSDTGTGMPPEVIAKAFDPFFTTKGVGRGTGLGLSQVYGFVKQSGGHIKIYSEVGQGTTVKLYLPRHFAPETLAGRTGEAAQKIQAGSAHETILVVEDDERVRTLSTDSLLEIGYRVFAVDNGAAALELVKTQPEIVLLFTDIIMPDMNGRKLADAALAIRPELKVLYTTGFTRNAVVHNGILDPGVKFIAKPFTIEQLAAKVREAIDT